MLRHFKPTSMYVCMHRSHAYTLRVAWNLFVFIKSWFRWFFSAIHRWYHPWNYIYNNKRLNRLQFCNGRFWTYNVGSSCKAVNIIVLWYSALLGLQLCLMAAWCIAARGSNKIRALEITTVQRAETENKAGQQLLYWRSWYSVAGSWLSGVWLQQSGDSKQFI